MSCDKDIERDLNVSVQAFAEGGEMIDGTFVVKNQYLLHSRLMVNLILLQSLMGRAGICMIEEV